MLLFPNNGEKATAGAKTFQIISPSASNLERISQLVKLAGFESIESFCQPLAEILKLPASPRGVVVDIGSRSDVSEIIAQIQAQIPRGAWCCVVGDSDSISLAQIFFQSGIHYFNLDTQSDALLQAISVGQQIKNTRSALCVSVLGCKGGSGSTTLAYRLVSRMSELRQTPMLFVQGPSGSRDLDLLTGKKASQEIFPVSKQLDALSWDEPNFIDTSHELYARYNFMVYEETICSVEKEHLRQVIEGSSCLVLVLDRSMSSIRIVRQINEIITSLNRSTAVTRRLILCLNNTRPMKLGMLEVDDIQDLQGRKLDLVIPYGFKRPASLFSRLRKASPLETLTLRVLGESPEHAGSSRKKPGKR
jgi:pilus assembly protein CpaE